MRACINYCILTTVPLLPPAGVPDLLPEDLPVQVVPDWCEWCLVRGVSGGEDLEVIVMNILTTDDPLLVLSSLPPLDNQTSHSSFPHSLHITRELQLKLIKSLHDTLYLEEKGCLGLCEELHFLPVK